MRAAKIKDHPSFPLMKQTDIQNVYHMQMPRWLFSDPRYADMSLDAKVTYTFLLNRFQLSRRNGWVNEHGEVFVIFPRKAMAAELRVCEQRVTAAFRKLAELQLIWEKRCGRGDANQIYMATVVPLEDTTYECAPFLSPDPDECGSRNADFEVLDGTIQQQEPQNPPPKNSKTCSSKTTESALLEPQKPRSSYTEISYPDSSNTQVSHSVGETGPTDEEKELMSILDACELSYFDPDIARIFENAIERLFYSDSFRVGNAILPQCRVRSKLYLLNSMVLREAENKLRANTTVQVRNSTNYVMSTIFNCITELDSDLIVDPYLNTLRAPPKGGE